MNRLLGFRWVLVAVLALAVAYTVGCAGGGAPGSADNANGSQPNENGADDNANVNDNTGGQENPVDDLWTTPPGSRTDYSGFQDTPLPADFFGPGSGAFSGTIVLQGARVSTVPPFALGPADTIVRRFRDDCPADVDGSVTVEAEIVALNLESAEPITITSDYGRDSELWDVRVCLSAQPQSRGSITIHREHEDGGTFDSSIPVLPKFIFTRQSDGYQVPLDCGEPNKACDVLQLEGTGNGWALIGGPGGFDPEDHGIVRASPGIPFDRDCDGHSDDETADPSDCFQPGMQPSDVSSSGFECTFNEEAESRLDGGGGGRHESLINSKDDRDSDGWPDECDNCPDIPSPDQTDSDDDGVGDICDNCPDDPNADQADGDGDDVGNTCDNCPDDPNADQTDSDGNGVGDACDSDVWSGLQGDYLVGAACEHAASEASLVEVDGTLVLRGLWDNDDIPLMLAGPSATASGVVVSGTDSRDLTMTIEDDIVTFTLVCPETAQSCNGMLKPA